MLIQVLYQCVLHLRCTVLRMYFRRSQIHLSTVKHLLSCRRCDSDPAFFSPWCFRLAVDTHDCYHLFLSYLTCCETLFLGVAVFIQVFFNYPCNHMHIYIWISKRNFPSQLQCLLVWSKFFLSTLLYTSLIFFVLHLLHSKSSTLNVHARNLK